MNRDGGVAFLSLDNFDNRSEQEIANTASKCVGCQSVAETTAGANWTDLSLSTSAPIDPYTAFDFVELSLFGVATARTAPIIQGKQPWIRLDRRV